ncbi:MAG TPA: GNAT family N-acetyltransferase [Chitinophagaceae bacterium]|nr:GNAT family N-acetyltransferase [Chitinophagaceae bacterium]
MQTNPTSSPLDNPIWHALTGRDQDKNDGTESIAWLKADIAPFIGMPVWDASSQHALLKTAPQGRNWFLLIADEVRFIDPFEVVFSIPLYQFVCTKLPTTAPAANDEAVVPLNSGHVEEMIALTSLTKPGPFTKRTIEFGNYHGIFREGKLVAMGGERLHIPPFTEVSAICTHPDYQGHGYGARITHHLAQLVIKKGETPFLHARVDNAKAINLYKRLGFEIRKEICFYIFRKK